MLVNHFLQVKYLKHKILKLWIMVLNHSVKQVYLVGLMAVAFVAHDVMTCSKAASFFA